MRIKKNATAQKHHLLCKQVKQELPQTGAFRTNDTLRYARGGLGLCNEASLVRSPVLRWLTTYT